MNNFEVSYVRHIVQSLKYDPEKNVIYWLGSDMLVPPPESSEEVSEMFGYWIPYFTMEYFKRHRLLVSFRETLMGKLTRYLKYYDFSPLHMTRVDMMGLVPRKVTLYDLPKMMVDVPLYILYADGMRMMYDKFFISGFSVCYGSLLNLPHAIVTGVYDVGYLSNLNKMSMNQVCPGPEISQSLMIAAIISLLHEVGHTEDKRMDFFVPDPELLKKVIEQYATSVGESPFKNVTLYDYRTGEIVKKGSPPTKKKIYGFILN